MISPAHQKIAERLKKTWVNGIIDCIVLEPLFERFFHMKFACCAGVLSACALALPVNGAVVDYVGNAGSGDISVAENWGGTLPGVSDTAVFPQGFLSPAEGLSLGGMLTLGDLSWNDTTGRELDLGGNTLTQNNPSGVSQLSIGANAVLTIKNGTFNVDSVTSRFLPGGDYGTFILTNATMNIDRPNWKFRDDAYGKGFAFEIRKDARLICTGFPAADMGFPMYGKDDCRFVIDGGFVSAFSNMGGWQRVGFNGEYGNGTVIIRNGGVLDVLGTSPALHFCGIGADVHINDSALYQTNGISWYTENYGIAFRVNINASAAVPRRGVFSVTNSTIKGTRFNLNGKHCDVTFHDSNVDFYFSGDNYAGFTFWSAAGSNTVTVSGSTAFKAKEVAWAPASANGNVFTVADGTFSAPVSMEGSNGMFVFSGGEGNGAITMTGVSNRVEITGGNWVHPGTIEIAGVSNILTIAGIASVTGTHTTVSGKGAILMQDGGTAFGGIHLVADGAVAILKNGAVRRAQHRTEGLQFKVGVANAKFIIEDSTYENNGNFSHYYAGSSHAYKDVACVYTNCPGSAIEFRGTNPKFINSSTTLYAGGGVYVAMVLGSFTAGDLLKGPTLGTEPLDNPVALRYILPPGGYAEAPLYGNVDYNKDRPIALCGNAKIEVDDSAFVRPRDRKHIRIPLIKDEANFLIGGYSMLDMDALNRNNAANLPVGSCLEHVPADKTVYLKITNSYGFTVTVR